MGTLKRNRQKEKEKNEQLLEAAKKREDSFTDDASHLSVRSIIKCSTCLSTDRLGLVSLPLSVSVDSMPMILYK